MKEEKKSSGKLSETQELMATAGLFFGKTSPEFELLTRFFNDHAQVNDKEFEKPLANVKRSLKNMGKGNLRDISDAKVRIEGDFKVLLGAIHAKRIKELPAQEIVQAITEFPESAGFVLKAEDVQQGFYQNIPVLGQLLNAAREDETGQLRQAIQSSKMLESDKINRDDVKDFIGSNDQRMETFRLLKNAVLRQQFYAPKTREAMEELKAIDPKPYKGVAGMVYLTEKITEFSSMLIDDVLKDPKLQQALIAEPKLITQLLDKDNRTLDEAVVDNVLNSRFIKDRKQEEEIKKIINPHVLFNRMNNDLVQLSKDPDKMFRQFDALSPEFQIKFLRDEKNKGSLIRMACNSKEFYLEFQKRIEKLGPLLNNEYQKGLLVADKVHSLKSEYADRPYDFLEKNPGIENDIFSALNAEEQEIFKQRIKDEIKNDPSAILKLLKLEKFCKAANLSPLVLNPECCRDIILGGTAEQRSDLLELLNKSELKLDDRYKGFADQLYERYFEELKSSPEKFNEFLEEHKGNFSVAVLETIIKNYGDVASQSFKDYCSGNIAIQVKQLVEKSSEPDFAARVISLVVGPPAALGILSTKELASTDPIGKIFRQGISDNPDCLLKMLQSDDPFLRRGVIGAKLVDYAANSEGMLKPGTMTMLGNSSAQFRLALLNVLDSEKSFKGVERYEGLRKLLKRGEQTDLVLVQQAEVKTEQSASVKQVKKVLKLTLPAAKKWGQAEFGQKTPLGSPYGSANTSPEGSPESSPAVKRRPKAPPPEPPAPPPSGPKSHR